MAKKRKKNVREKGKIRLSEYFKEIKVGDRTNVVEEKSIRRSFPDRIIGKQGEVIGERGEYKIVQIKDGKKLKKFIIHPINLRIAK
ncbi:MAG: 50S ribosomal protein L21e [Candidatus Pacearchaeota archaeon]